MHSEFVVESRGCVLGVAVRECIVSVFSVLVSFWFFLVGGGGGGYVAFNTVQVISRQVVGRAEEASTYSFSGLCTANCLPTASNYHLRRPCREPNPGLRGRRLECYHSAIVAPCTCK